MSYNLLDVEIVRERVGPVSTVRDDLYDASLLVGGMTDLLQAAAAGIQTQVQQAKEGAVRERIAILPQQVVAAPLEEGDQIGQHLLTRHGRQAHVRDHGLVRIARVREPGDSLRHTLDAETVLDVVHAHRAVVARTPGKPGPNVVEATSTRWAELYNVWKALLAGEPWCPDQRTHR
eukprot:CAMPEP_0177418916 /NCGR_PEP_ID=MMETSP0368-20130122/69432_1 /TAXON_ID=447022 ORGANISM="Scrippsiella hangoei-like, Strain SHHI-4" /NCGR_SAMPLE_ID=MMETSP0368 /ASSEMBLY_ACC=CAM_ASM_000363 /LENGTH=175 /DNA_ID=CAMNT_0018888583 /DNA_START=276 /DNA_END=804 /DNA_ORIENTATION=-